MAVLEAVAAAAAAVADVGCYPVFALPQMLFDVVEGLPMSVRNYLSSNRQINRRSAQSDRLMVCLNDCLFSTMLGLRQTIPNSVDP